MARPHPAHIITDDSAIGGKLIEKSVRCDRATNAYFTRTSDEAGDRLSLIHISEPTRPY